MATQDIERLVVSLEANVKSYEREMKRARDIVNKQLSAVEKRTGTHTQRLQKMMGTAGETFSKGLMAVGLGGIATGGVIGAIENIRSAMGDLANTAAEAKRAGLGVEAFQELRFAAMQSKVSTDALVDGMKELQLRADEFITTGAGSGAEAFQRLGYSAEELNRKLQDPPKLLEEIIEKMQTLDQSAQIRIADEIFGGTGGEQFVRFLDRGVDGIAKAREEARQTGNVLSQELIARAEEVDRAFNTWSTTLSTNVKASLVGIVRMVGEMSSAVDSYRNKLGSTDLTGADFQRQERIKQLQGNLARTGGRTSAASSWRQELEELTELQRQRARMGRPFTADAPAVAGPAAPTGGKGDLSHITKPGSDRGTADSARAIVDGYAQIEKAALARIESLRVEQQALGLTTAEAEKLRFETELLADATRDGTTLTQAQKDRISELATQYGTLSAAIETAAEAQDEARARMEEFQSIAKDSLGGFISDLRQGKDAAEALTNVMDRLADRMIDMALNSLFDGKGGLGNIGSMIGSIFAPGRATGGPVYPGQPYTVGESGRELFVPTSPGRIIPNGKFGGGSSVVIHNYTGAPVQTRQVSGPQGPRTEVLIGDAINRAGYNGDLDRMMKQRYGLRPMGGR